MTAIDQKAYLQKYLTGRSNDKKKKKKKQVKGKGFKIIDDDIDLSKMRPLDGDELDILNEGEDAPQIAGIIDERPEELKMEDFKTSSKWRVINQDDGFTSKLQIEEVKRNNKEVEKENEIVFGKMYSDSEDSDPSPSRKPEKSADRNKTDRQTDSDVSPPRKDSKHKSDTSAKHNDSTRKSRKPTGYDSDTSPPRKRSIEKPSDAKHKKSNYDSDVSPPRKRSKDKKDPPKKDKRKKPSRWEEEQPYQSRPSKSPEKFSKNYDSDPSPQRKSQNFEDGSPSRKRKSDKSKDYRNRTKAVKNESDSDLSPPRKRQNSQDSDSSPPRQRKHEKTKDHRTKKSKNSSDSDLSPPRKDKRHRNRNDSDSDLSPPRKGKYDKSNSLKKMEKTLDGKKAGLQDAKQLKDENQAFRRREDEAFRNMTDEMSGRNARVVSRKSKRETSEDRQKQREKAERQKELDEKYKKWSKGIKQIEAQQAAVQDFLHESSKPLARYKGDNDLEDKLKDVERDGDPMLQYMRERKRERGELGPEKPTYRGNFPPNRFNIRPGYRWDGVDRSNGYEKKYFTQQSKRKAQEEEAYKWSTEDL